MYVLEDNEKQNIKDMCLCVERQREVYDEGLAHVTLLLFSC